MKKRILAAIGACLMLYLSGCNDDVKEVHIDFPFEVNDVEKVETYLYVGVPADAEKKVVAEVADIEDMYAMFEQIVLQNKEVEETTGASVASFRFVLDDGTEYEIIYVGYGVKNGTLKFDTEKFEYFTSSDIGQYWHNLPYESTSAVEMELPAYAQNSTVLPEVSDEGTELYDLIPMVMVDGTLYLTTGYESSVEVRCGVMDGEITSTVEGHETPTENNQSNFGAGYSYQYGATPGTIEICMDGKWWIYATEEVRQEMQFPSEDTIQFLGITMNKSELSQETIKWLAWYNGLKEEEQLSVSYIPNDLLKISASSTATVIEVIESYVAESGKGTYKEAVEISGEDAVTLADILDSEDWVEAAPDCENDCVVNIGGRLYHYHSECGTFVEVIPAEMPALSHENVNEVKNSLHLTDEEKSTVNSLLEKYIELGNTVFLEE